MSDVRSWCCGCGSEECRSGVTGGKVAEMSENTRAILIRFYDGRMIRFHPDRSFCGHEIMSAMWDSVDDAKNLERNDQVEAAAKAHEASRCPSCGCYEGQYHHDDCGAVMGLHSGGSVKWRRYRPVEVAPGVVMDLKTAAEYMDPWAHRSAGMRCRTCMWWVEKVPTGGYHGDPLRRKAIGRCRRHAPALTGFPVVMENDWCGDHRLDEAKA